VALGEEGRVLLLRRSQARGGFWQPVTGRIEPGESPAQAARRELREETGADVPVEPLGYAHSFGLEPGIAALPGGGLQLAHETAFAARLPAGFAPALSEEHGAWGWFGVDEALERLRYAGLRRALRLAVGRVSAAGPNPTAGR